MRHLFLGVLLLFLGNNFIACSTADDVIEEPIVEATEDEIIQKYIQDNNLVAIAF